MERRGLNLEVITTAAIGLLDEVGLAELSTRRLAAKLGVQSPTLYWHVKNKAELLDLVAAAVSAGSFDLDADTNWRDQVTSGLRQLRDLLLAHPGAAALLRDRPPEPRLATINGILHAAGFERPDTAIRLLWAHVLDATPDDADPTDTEHFELGVEVILDGLRHRLLR